MEQKFRLLLIILDIGLAMFFTGASVYLRLLDAFIAGALVMVYLYTDLENKQL